MDGMPSLRGSSCSPWKDISHGYSSFLQCCNFVVGNGESVRFWEDSWLEDRSLNVMYPRPYLLSGNHEERF